MRQQNHQLLAPFLGQINVAVGDVESVQNDKLSELEPLFITLF